MGSGMDESRFLHSDSRPRSLHWQAYSHGWVVDCSAAPPRTAQICGSRLIALPRQDLDVLMFGSLLQRHLGVFCAPKLNVLLVSRHRPVWSLQILQSCRSLNSGHRAPDRVQSCSVGCR